MGGSILNKLDIATAGAEIMKSASTVDCSVMVVNDQGIIVAYLPADYMLQFPLLPKPGDEIPAGTPIRQCLETKKPITTILPRSEIGIKLKMRNWPVFDEDGKLLGVVNTSVSMDTQDAIHTVAKTLAATTTEMKNATEHLETTATILAGDLDKVRTGGENVLTKINKTDDILKFVSDVATNSNLLGLNAAIEAARAGEQGKGFAVVAEEIRKMAVNSANSVNEIKRILQDIHYEMTVVVKTIIRTSEISAQQAAATEEIAATLHSLASTATDMAKIAEVI
jgi:hypothetical protein